MATLQLFTPSAFADASNMSNWAGYAVHRSGISFRHVSGSWIQPTLSCPGRRPTFSAYWVGLGGFSQYAPALEQIGIGANCASGQPALGAWYELWPAPPVSIRLTVAAGDHIVARVTVVGHQVTLSIYDATRHRGFCKLLHVPVIDTSSAEWVVEAPSECTTMTGCQTLPLADFGTVPFGSARAESSRRCVGSISSRGWKATKISLTPDARRFVANRGSGASAGAAIPSALRAGGRAFTVAFARAAG